MADKSPTENDIAFNHGVSHLTTKKQINNL